MSKFYTEMKKADGKLVAWLVLGVLAFVFDLPEKSGNQIIPFQPFGRK